MHQAFVNRREVLSWGAALALQNSTKTASPGTQLLAESWIARVGRCEFFHTTPRFIVCAKQRSPEACEGSDARRVRCAPDELTSPSLVSDALKIADVLDTLGESPQIVMFLNVGSTQFSEGCSDLTAAGSRCFTGGSFFTVR